MMGLIEAFTDGIRFFFIGLALLTGPIAIVAVLVMAAAWLIYRKDA